MFGCSTGDLEIVSLLLGIKEICGDNIKCIMKACEKDNVNVLGMLLEKSPKDASMLSLLVGDKGATTCLMTACKKGNINVAVCLMKKIVSLFSEVTCRSYSHNTEVSSTYILAVLSLPTYQSHKIIHISVYLVLPHFHSVHIYVIHSVL